MDFYPASSISLNQSDRKAQSKPRSFSTVQEEKYRQKKLLSTITQANKNNSCIRYQSLNDSLGREPFDTSMNFSCPRLLRFEEKASHSHGSRQKSLSILKYNKWYIKPSLRLKGQTDNNSSTSKTRTKSESYELYNNLYKQQSIDQKNPLQSQKNRKADNLDSISIDNIVILQKFKECLEKNKKRVPKIVNVFMEKKLKQIQNEKKT